MINANWSRWIFTSVGKHFKDALDPRQVILEGQNVLIAEGAGDFIEIRMSGPTWKESTKDQYSGSMVTINNLIKLVQKEKEFYEILKYEGEVAKAFVNCIPIMKYGDGTDDDPTVKVGTLIRKSDVDVESFGKVAPDYPSIQSTVQAVYSIELL